MRRLGFADRVIREITRLSRDKEEVVGKWYEGELFPNFLLQPSIRMPCSFVSLLLDVALSQCCPSSPSPESVFIEEVIFCFSSFSKSHAWACALSWLAKLRPPVSASFWLLPIHPLFLQISAFPWFYHAACPSLALHFVLLFLLAAPHPQFFRYIFLLLFLLSLLNTTTCLLERSQGEEIWVPLIAFFVANPVLLSKAIKLCLAKISSPCSTCLRR